MFTAVAVLSLALGIGANSAIFSMVNGLLLRTLPVRDPSRLVLLDGGSWTNPLWEQVRDRRAAFAEGAAAWGTERFDLARGGQSEFVDGLYASGGYFEILGVRAMLGRTFTPADDRRGGGPDGPVAVISYRWWQARFGGAADIIGRPLSLNRARFTIIGVTPPGFLGPVVGRAFDVTVPLGTVDLFRDGPENALDSRSWWWLDIMLRLKPGETIEEATRALRGLQPQIRRGDDAPGLAGSGPGILPARRVHAGQRCRRPVGAPEGVRAASADPDGGGGPRAVHRVRKHRQPAAGPRHGAPARAEPCAAHWERRGSVWRGSC